MIVFEAWLALVVLAVMVLGLAERAAWVARFALLSGATAVLLTLSVNPDAWVAARNIDRYEATGKLDTWYLSTLSPDAAPVVLERLPADVAACVLRASAWTVPSNSGTDPERAWSWAGSRGMSAVEEFLAEHPEATGAACPDLEYPSDVP